MVETQGCHLVEAIYVEGAETKREPFREQHLERLRKLHKEGALLLAGPFADMSATLLILAVESEDAAEAIVKSDIYWRQGVWTGYKIRRVNLVPFDE
ncbi:MAG: YciI family protein [Actinomycetota bacterium]|nr:YciI family protein [Actinomycetota bacterium]